MSKLVLFEFLLLMMAIMNRKKHRQLVKAVENSNAGGLLKGQQD